MMLRLPKYPSKASGAGFVLDAVGSPVLDTVQIPLKNQRDRRDLALWPNLTRTHHNQPGINDSGKGDVGERGRGGWSVWGDVVPSFG